MKLIDPSLQITKGHRRALLFHPVRKKIDLVPNSMADLLNTHTHFDPGQLVTEYGEHMKEILGEYEGFLQERGYLLNESIPFGPVNQEWQSPHHISTSIVEITGSNADIFKQAVAQLGGLGCHTIEVRALEPVGLSTLSDLLSCIDQTRIKSILLILPFHPDYTVACMEAIVNAHLRISSIIISGSPGDGRYEFHRGATIILFSRKPFDPVLSCGVIRINNFDFNKFKEARTHNSCLNRKISILADGTIKNCPSLLPAYGNIRARSLKEVIADPDFLFYWTIRKDQVKKCRDCEFRLFCYDCRAFLENPEDVYSKPLKCGYDPYGG